MPNITENLFNKVQKAKKCDKCKFCLKKHITKKITYKICLWKTAKLYTRNDTVKQCEFYKKKELKCLKQKKKPKSLT